MSALAAYLDRAIGETRGVVTLNQRPERLLIRRDGDPASQRLGARSTARVIAAERGLSTAFLRMPDGPDVVTPLGPGDSLVQGGSVSVEVMAEPRSGKGAVVRVLEGAVGPPRLTREAPELEAWLQLWAPGEIVTGDEARDAADEAQDAALMTVHPLPGGGSVSIETTRALTAIDVDVGARGGGDGPRAVRQTNLAAIGAGARLLRLKGLGGLVVFDLAGQGHNGPALSAAAKAAFAPDNPGVSIGPISRFGLFEMALPWRTTPLTERLLDETGQVSTLTSALAMMRSLEREARANPGARLVVRCPPDVADAAKPYLADLLNRIGSRFSLDAAAGESRTHAEVSIL